MKLQNKDIKDYLSILEKTFISDIKNVFKDNDDLYKVIKFFLSDNYNKIVIGGVGKSYKLASKFAASLCSIGYLSIPIHPNDSRHGDLGIIGDRDLLVLISSSGNTSEVIDLYNISKEKHPSITTISITSGMDNKLYDLSDYRLCTGVEQEPITYKKDTSVTIPTSSSLATLSMINVILCSLVSFDESTKPALKNNHKGGYIGNLLKTN